MRITIGKNDRINPFSSKRQLFFVFFFVFFHDFRYFYYFCNRFRILLLIVA